VVGGPKDTTDNLLFQLPLIKKRGTEGGISPRALGPFRDDGGSLLLESKNASALSETVRQKLGKAKSPKKQQNTR